jgi:hypothetical protein
MLTILMKIGSPQDDKNIAHLTHVSEMEKKCESLARITTILKDVIQNKDRIIARLQQPYSLDCIPVEAEYQVRFLIISTCDFHNKHAGPYMILLLKEPCGFLSGSCFSYSPVGVFSETIFRATSESSK